MSCRWEEIFTTERGHATSFRRAMRFIPYERPENVRWRDRERHRQELRAHWGRGRAEERRWSSPRGRSPVRRTQPVRDRGAGARSPIRRSPPSRGGARAGSPVRPPTSASGGRRWDVRRPYAGIPDPLPERGSSPYAGERRWTRPAAVDRGRVLGDASAGLVTRPKGEPTEDEGRVKTVWDVLYRQQCVLAQEQKMTGRLVKELCRGLKEQGEKMKREKPKTKEKKKGSRAKSVASVSSSASSQDSATSSASSS